MQFYADGGYVAFDQIYGHLQIVDFGAEAWQSPGRVRPRATANWDARHVRVRIGGRVFTGVDPKLGRSGAVRWRPLVLTDAEILVGSSGNRRRAGSGETTPDRGDLRRRPMRYSNRLSVFDRRLYPTTLGAHSYTLRIQPNGRW